MATFSSISESVVDAVVEYGVCGLCCSVVEFSMSVNDESFTTDSAVLSKVACVVVLSG